MKKILFVFMIILLGIKWLALLSFYTNFPRINGLYFKLPAFNWNEKKDPQVFMHPEERERFDWKSILYPCKDDRKWKFRTPHHQAKQNRTSARHCIISDYEINPAGYYSKFVLQTKTQDGTSKHIGGDYWRAYLTGTVYQNGFVYDLNDGRYEVWLSIAQPGSYHLNLVLEYSLCDGLRDPPDGWFEKGNIHGRFQEEGILGYLDDFLVDKFTRIDFKVENSEQQIDRNFTANGPILVFNGKEQMDLMNTSSYSEKQYLQTAYFNRSCMHVWDGYGHWKRDNKKFIWEPNFSIKPADFTSKSKLETLWFLGDSLTYRLWDSSYTRVLCRQAFKKCKKTYTWVYEISAKGEVKKPINVGLRLNYTRFFEPLHTILRQPEMQTNRSVIVINFGLHIVMSLDFNEYKNLFEEFVSILDFYRSQENKTATPQFIWKTTTLSHKENTRKWNVTQARFLSNQRISLFNAYANSRLCAAGVTILDIFPISASYPLGTLDHVHYENFVFEPVEDALADFVWKVYNT